MSCWEEPNDTYERCVSIPLPAAGVVEKPTTSSMNLHLKWKISLLMKEAGGNMYQRYIFLQAWGGPSVQISTHMVQRRMETRIDQSNINIYLTILKITIIISILNLG